MDPMISEIVGSLAKMAVEAPIAKLADIDPLHLQDIPILRRLGTLRLRQVERAVTHLQAQLRNVAIDSDLERQLAFGNLGIRFFEAASKEHRDIQLAILAAATVQPLNAKNSDPFDIQLEFFGVIERLQPFHVSLLAYISEHHTREKPGGHDHLFTATFQEVLGTGLQLPKPRETWLSAALVTLRELDLLRFQLGGMAQGGGYGFSPVTEPYLIVQNSTFGLSEYGCKLLGYVRNGIEPEPWWDEPASRA